MRIDSSGRLLVGTSTALSNVKVTSVTGNTPKLQLQGQNDSYSTSISVTNSSGSSYGPAIALNASKGTQASPTVVSNAGDLGFLTFNGYDGTNYIPGAHIAAFVDGTPGSNDMPGRLVFSTTSDSASSPTERMRITNGGDIGMSAGLTLGTVTPTAGGFYSTAGILGTGAGTNAVKYSTTTGKITYDTSSRFNKTDIQDCPYGIAEVKQLLPRRYYRTDDERLEVGFVADEVASILPEFVPFGPKSAVTGNEEDTEVIPVNVNYDKLTAVLTKALQEAIMRIETLEAEVAALKGA
jgi:hypothetical protein